LYKDGRKEGISFYLSIRSKHHRERRNPFPNSKKLFRNEVWRHVHAVFARRSNREFGYMCSC